MQGLFNPLTPAPVAGAEALQWKTSTGNFDQPQLLNRSV